jgi:phosphatidylethanolamine-binding protein (PEBP) family uncharacterized protein
MRTSVLLASLARSKNDPPHHYHFQVIAADTSLNLDPGATAAEVLAALEGYVVARGELIGTFRVA